MAIQNRAFDLDDSTVHLCIDMQRLFAEGTAWQVPWLPRILPGVLEIARRHASRTIFTRFVPPERPDRAEGAWRDYFGRWREMTRGELDPRLLELVPSLAALVPPARVVDKSVNSVFGRRGLARALKARGVTTLVVTGGETDVCVLATVMAAIDLGFRVVLPVDALCSTFDDTHDALVRLYRQRFSQQVEATDIEDVLRRWSPPRRRGMQDDR
jgi:nicotinamidase-related amidase